MNDFENILVGLSLADALGVPVEFKSRNQLKLDPVISMREYGSHGQPAGTWSDDSSLSFCLAKSLCNSYNLVDIAMKFVSWKNENYWTPRGRVFDIGIQTKSSIDTLERLLASDNLKAIELLRYDEFQDEMSNGNGSLMRILPLVFEIRNLPIDVQFEFIWNVSALTHPHIRSAIACLIYLKFAEFVLQGFTLHESYFKMKNEINDFLINKEISNYEKLKFDRILLNDIIDLREDEISSSGYVISTLEASLWCLLNTNSYLDSVFKAINLGDDTDTTATVVGGIAGLYYGLGNVPRDWINNLARIEDILELSESLARKYND